MNTFTAVIKGRNIVVFDHCIARSRLTYIAPNTNYFVLNQNGSALSEIDKDRLANAIVNHAIGLGISAIEVKKFMQPYQKKKIPTQKSLFD